jgi:hypothetical protein
MTIGPIITIHLGLLGALQGQGASSLPMNLHSDHICHVADRQIEVDELF